MGRGKVSRTPASLQDLLSGGPDFISSISHMHRARMRHGVGGSSGTRRLSGDLGTSGFWHYPKVRDRAMVLELQIGVGVGWLRALGAGAALGVNLRKLERPLSAWRHYLRLHPLQKHLLGRVVNFLKNKNPACTRLRGGAYT